jgi:1-acyl-sn-glycerol-3-phosphate acyltransferase
VAVTGSEDAVAVRRLKRLKRLDILINIGTPFSLPAQETGLTRDEFIKKYTEEVMCQIALLLPAERRGIYAEHPRLKDLLACRQAII